MYTDEEIDKLIEMTEKNWTYVIELELVQVIKYLRNKLEEKNKIGNN